MSENYVDQNYNLEIQLIIECSKTAIDDKQRERLSSILSQPLDWSYILKISRRNGVLPLLSWNLVQKFDQFLPSEIKTVLTETFSKHLRQNMLQTSRMIEIVHLFKSNDIPALPYKGPLLAIQAYKNLALRHFGDLDILILPNHLEKALNLLSLNGYTVLTASHWLDNIKSCLKQKKDISLISEDNKVFLELHWKLSRSYFDIPIKTEDLWSESKITTLAGFEVNTLSANHLLLYLCLHGSKHSWDRLSWICDINELILSQNTIDWNQLIEDAKQLGCENVLNFGLYLAYEFFNLQVPITSQLKNTKKYKTFRTLARETRTRLFSEDTRQLQLYDNYTYQLKLKERFQDKYKLHKYYARRYFHVLLNVNEVDRRNISLPNWLYPLYYILRPTRLVYNFLSSNHNKK